MRAVARVGKVTQRCDAQDEPNPKKSGVRFFHAEAHISTESPQPFEDARLPHPHEDEERGRGAVEEAREGP